MSIQLKAQDTVSLAVVEIIAKKISLSQIGKKTVTIDSTVKEQFRFNSVADLLVFNSPVFIKSYGPGALATTAFRGGNASQTAVLWNGFNLQNAMLGQSDLALMPSVLFEDVEIEYGGSSSLWGSGAVGGSIHLNNKHPFNKGFRTALSLGGGSTGSMNGSAHILVSKQRFVSSTKLYQSSSKNNFAYSDTTDKKDPVKKQKNAAYTFRGLMQEFKFILNSKQIISLNAWINANERRLPAVNNTFESKTYQFDGATRLSANWSCNATRFKSVVRGAYFAEKINYTDSLASVFSKSRVQTVMAENENYFSWLKHQQLNLGLNFSSSSASVSEYRGQRTLSRLSVLAGNRSYFLKGKLTTYVCARVEYFSVGTLPLTGNFSAEYSLLKGLVAKGNVARVYRQPTLNDLYWMPGGNIHLKPEQGYTLEGELSYKKERGPFLFFISGAAYSRKIDNWILWVPGASANPSPVNIQQVWSRGTETSWKITYTKNKLRLCADLATGYVLSTAIANSQENNSATGKQLIYTPRYTINDNVSAVYKRAGLFFFHQYVGYRFTTSDNSTWLPPYHVCSVKFNYSQPLKKINLSLFAACNNLFNSNYRIITGRPMPLRNFEIGITFRT
ncbi:MAG: TonB-dependent receptor [Bacteroidota bacterium]